MEISTVSTGHWASLSALLYTKLNPAFRKLTFYLPNRVLRSKLTVCSVTINPRQGIASVNDFVLKDKMRTAFQNHCPSCYTNHGGVYSRRCFVLYQSPLN